MDYSIELRRTKVTVSEFYNYVKHRCAQRGIDPNLYDLEEFKNPTHPMDARYRVKGGIKYCIADGCHYQCSGEDAPAMAEIVRQLPYDMQTYILNFDGSIYNLICEFTFDGEGLGHGYYYQMNKDAAEISKNKDAERLK